MKEQDTRAPIQIGNILVTAEYENENVCLILDNRDEKAKSVTMSHEGSQMLGIKPSKATCELQSRAQQKARLPKGFEKWKKLDFEVKVENQGRVEKESIAPKKLLAEAKRQLPQPKTEPSISISDQTNSSKNIKDKDLKPDLETPNESEQPLIDYQREADTIFQETQKQIEQLARIYKDGEAIDYVSIENPTPGQKTLMILNWIVRTIENWVDELEQSGTANPDLIQTLGFANQTVKDKLKEIRGPAPPLPEPLDPDTDISTDAAYNELEERCAMYVARYEGLLAGYQLGRKIDETEYNQFIPQFIKDRLFNGIARFLSVEQFPDRLYQCLQLVGYEVVPIEIGETKADARMHDIQSSRQTGVAPGSIAEVILPGLRCQVDGEIVQNPVVIRGE